MYEFWFLSDFVFLPSPDVAVCLQAELYHLLRSGHWNQLGEGEQKDTSTT